MRNNRPPRILVIDDELSIREGFRNFLEDFDYDVLTAENGHTGLKKFSGENPDLVLLDMVMPKMNGRDALKAIRKINPLVRIVLTSGINREIEKKDKEKQNGK